MMSDPTIHHQQLEVGDLVRVVLRHSRECPEAPHVDDEPGHTGRIVGKVRSVSTPTHPYLVLFDRPCLYLSPFGASTTIPVRHYALDEIEPVERAIQRTRREHHA